MSASELPVNPGRDALLRQLLRSFAGTLQDIVGLDEAEGYISIFGARSRASISRDWPSSGRVARQACGPGRLTQAAAVSSSVAYHFSLDFGP